MASTTNNSVPSSYPPQLTLSLQGTTHLTQFTNKVHAVYNCVQTNLHLRKFNICCVCVCVQILAVDLVMNMICRWRTWTDRPMWEFLCKLNSELIMQNITKQSGPFAFCFHVVKPRVQNPLLTYGMFLKDHTYFKYVNKAWIRCNVRLQNTR